MNLCQQCCHKLKGGKENVQSDYISRESYSDYYPVKAKCPQEG